MTDASLKPIVPPDIFVLWNSEDGKKYQMNETITSAVVADGVRNLRSYCDFWQREVGSFESCSSLHTCALPDTLRRIGDFTFASCNRLTICQIPSGVNEIGRGAFTKCGALKTLALPDGILHIPGYAFSHCNSLETVELPFSLKTIGVEAFCNCFELNAINDDALEGVTEIGEAAFSHCSSLTAFKLPPLLKVVDECSFFACESLSKVEFPPSLETIKFGAFNRCSHPDLIIDLPETVTNIGIEALAGCRIRLPTSLSILTKGWSVIGLLNQVKEVVISSRVNLRVLANTLHDLEDAAYEDGEPWLYPGLTFKVLYGGLPSVCSPLLPPPNLNEHVPESIFSLAIAASNVTSLYYKSGAGVIATKTHSSFMGLKVPLIAGIIKCSNPEIPEALLYHVLPFLWGNEVSEVVLKEVVAAVGEAVAKMKLRKLVGAQLVKN